MFIGHHAVAFAAKRAAPRTSLGVLIGATMFLDLIWPVLLLTGVERMRIDPGNTAFTPLAFDSYPFSHSLATSLALGVLVACVYWRITRYGTGAWMVGAAVFSHWVLDFISHRPDLPLAPGVPTLVGLGLWNSVPSTLLVEFFMFAAGLGLYFRATQPKSKTGHLSLWIFVAFLGLIYLGNAFGPPPPSWQAVGWVGLAGWILPFWAAWVDQRRIVAT